MHEKQHFRAEKDLFVCIHQILLPFLRGLVEYIYFTFIGAGRDGTLCTSFLRNTENLSCLLPFVHQKQRWKNEDLELILKKALMSVLTSQMLHLHSAALGLYYCALGIPKNSTTARN